MWEEIRAENRLQYAGALEALSKAIRAVEKLGRQYNGCPGHPKQRQKMALARELEALRRHELNCTVAQLNDSIDRLTEARKTSDLRLEGEVQP